jgi:hypothetical protein
VSASADRPAIAERDQLVVQIYEIRDPDHARRHILRALLLSRSAPLTSQRAASSIGWAKMRSVLRSPLSSVWPGSEEHRWACPIGFMAGQLHVGRLVPSLSLPTSMAQPRSGVSR